MDLVEKMASIPAFAEQAATLKTLLQQVGGESGEKGSPKPDMVAAAKSLKEASAKSVSVAGKSAKHAEQLASAEAALHTLHTTKIGLEREEKEATQALIKAQADYDEAVAYKTKEINEAKQHEADVAEEIELNPDEEVTGDEIFLKIQAEAKRRCEEEIQRGYQEVSRRISGKAAPPVGAVPPTPPPTLTPQQILKQKQDEEDKQEASSRASESLKNIAKAAKTAAGQSAATAVIKAGAVGTAAAASGSQQKPADVSASTDANMQSG